jgi:hypothetical protein
MKETKQNIMDAVNSHLGLPLVRVSSGSSEPREFLSRIIELLGLRRPELDAKPGLAQGIVESAGFQWLPSYESRGSTVTLEGLRAVQRAVFLLVPPR